MLTPGKGEALAMISTRCGNHTGNTRPLALQAIHVEKPATHLEGTGRAMVLVLDDDIRTQPGRKKRPGVLGCRRHRRIHDLLRGFEFSEGEHAHTSCLPLLSITSPISPAKSGRIISLCALPEGIIGRQFSSFATRQSKITGPG